MRTRITVAGAALAPLATVAGAPSSTPLDESDAPVLALDHDVRDVVSIG